VNGSQLIQAVRCMKETFQKTDMTLKFYNIPEVDRTHVNAKFYRVEYSSL